MSAPLRLLFDDWLSKHAVNSLREIAQFSRGAVEVSYLATLNCEGKLDDEWVPQLAGGGYLLITTDRAKKKSRGSKLPVLCRRSGLRHVMLSAAVHSLSQFDKLRAIFSVWPKLLNAASAPPGAGFLLKKTSLDAFDLVPVPPRRDDDATGR